MMSSEQILEQVAQDGSIDVAEWPRVLETVLQRLNDIVHNDFPLPAIPLPAILPSTVDPSFIASTPPNEGAEEKDEELPDANGFDASQNSQSSTKENDAPLDMAVQRRSGVGSETGSNPQQLTQPPHSVATNSGTLPPDLLSLYTTSTHALENHFAQSPPYTIQRLAELVLHPKRHHRFLPPYLRALDRIVSVSSPVSDFPLPSLHPSTNGGFLTNGDGTQVNGIGEADTLGSDESLGGALLTPIPWLNSTRSLSNSASAASASSQTHAQNDGELHSERTDTIDGPRGTGRIETVSVTVNGVPSATSAAHTTPLSPTPPEQNSTEIATSQSPPPATPHPHLRDQGGVTQGELLRQEQEAGVVPVSQTPPRRALMSATGGNAAVGRDTPNQTNQPANGHQQNPSTTTTSPAPSSLATSSPPASSHYAHSAPPGSPPLHSSPPAPTPDATEAPHARGPDVIGMEDMGPQHGHSSEGLDMEAAVGRARSPLPRAELGLGRVEGEGAGGDGSGDGDVDVEMEDEGSGVRQGGDGKEGIGEGVKGGKGDRELGEDTVLADPDGRTGKDMEKGGRLDEGGDSEMS